MNVSIYPSGCASQSLSACYLTYQQMEYDQTLVTGALEANDELIRFQGYGVKVKVIGRSTKCEFLWRADAWASKYHLVYTLDDLPITQTTASEH